MLDGKHNQQLKKSLHVTNDLNVNTCWMGTQNNNLGLKKSKTKDNEPKGQKNANG